MSSVSETTSPRTDTLDHCMVWITSPAAHVPLPLSAPIVQILPIPHTPLLVVVASTSVTLFDSQSLLPLANHLRLPECLQTHGPCVEVQVPNLSVDSAQSARLSSVNLYVKTKLNFVLIYHVFLNYGRGVYEVCSVSNGDQALQNSLPVAAASGGTFLASLKSATRSLIHGSAGESAMVNVDHFHNDAFDDSERNEPLPATKITLFKILKLAHPIRWFWCKSNSHNLVFVNSDNQLQILNTKTFKSESVAFADYTWFYDIVAMGCNLNHNYFLSTNSENELSLVEVEAVPGQLTLNHKNLATLPEPVTEFAFNPQSDLVLFVCGSKVHIYSISPTKSAKLEHIKTLNPTQSQSATDTGPVRCQWSPCGEYFTCLYSKNWTIYSKFGNVRFSSENTREELQNAGVSPENVEALTRFCKIKHLAIAPNAQSVYVVDHHEKMLYRLQGMNLLRCNDGAPMFYDDSYISIPSPSNRSMFLRVPMLPTFQKIIANATFVNGTARKLATRKPTGTLTVETNDSNQLSMAYGPHVAISTPIAVGTEHNQVFWYQFYNHVTTPMNVVHHFWIGDFLVLVNRKDEDEDAADSSIDELVILSTAASKNGAGGVDFKFDSDKIAWSHTFKNKIVNYQVSEGKEPGQYSLILITLDMKIIVIEIQVRAKSAGDKTPDVVVESARISIKVQRTIHLSSIKHKLSISSLQEMHCIDGKHFVFLMDNGSLFLLKNQSPGSTDVVGNQLTNVYELAKVRSAVERFSVNDIKFGDNTRQTFLFLFMQNVVTMYTVDELVASPDFDSESEKVKPISIDTESFTPLEITQTAGTFGLLGFQHEALAKSDNLILKQRPRKLLILNKLIRRELFAADYDVGAITARYSSFANYNYCVELLLFEELDNIDKAGTLDRVCELVDASSGAASIYVNFLRKIEVEYWPKFFDLLQSTPLDFMNKLIQSQDVDLCYNYLSIYLNFRRELETRELLGETEKAVIVDIVLMLQKAEKWDQCFELCRYIKLLQPSGDLLREVRAGI